LEFFDGVVDGDGGCLLARDDPKAIDKYEHGEKSIHGAKLGEAQKRIVVPRRQLAS
jgi:hypothetical protein